MSGVNQGVEAEFWAFCAQWQVFARRVAASFAAREYLLALVPVHRDAYALSRLEIAQSMVRSMLAAQACAEALK